MFDRSIKTTVRKAVDDFFRVEVIRQTPSPQQAIWLAAHNDYSEKFIFEDRDNWPDEERSGELIVKHLLAGGRGHWGPSEHVYIQFACGYFPHSVVVQARTHRIASFDVQSQRYTSQRVLNLVEGKLPIEAVFYIRPAGEYTDRQGDRYTYTELQRERELERCLKTAEWYAEQINEGVSEEQARDVLAQGIRQHFVFSLNARSFQHMADLRLAKLDAQLEIREMMQLCWPHFNAWVPAIAEYYERYRMGKGKLAP